MKKELKRIMYEHGQIRTLFKILTQSVNHCVENEDSITHVIVLTEIIDDKMRKLHKNMNKLRV